MSGSRPYSPMPVLPLDRVALVNPTGAWLEAAKEKAAKFVQAGRETWAIISKKDYEKIKEAINEAMD